MEIVIATAVEVNYRTTIEDLSQSEQGIYNIIVWRLIY